MDHVDKGTGKTRQALVHPGELMNGHHKEPSKISVEELMWALLRAPCLALTRGPWDPLALLCNRHGEQL